MNLGDISNYIKVYMKEILINILGALLLVYMVLAVAVFTVVLGCVFILMLLVKSVLNFVSNMVKGPSIVISRSK